VWRQRAIARRRLPIRRRYRRVDAGPLSLKPPLDGVTKNGRRGNLLQHQSLDARKAVLITESNWTLSEDRRVEDAGGQIRSRGGRVNAIRSPEFRTFLRRDHCLPCVTHWRDRNAQLRRDTKVSLIDRSLKWPMGTVYLHYSRLVKATAHAPWIRLVRASHLIRPERRLWDHTQSQVIALRAACAMTCPSPYYI
jgi:hypothetical protein